MLLTPDEASLFFKLHKSLMFFVNERLKVIPEKLGSPEHFASLSPQIRLRVRDALIKHVNLIEDYVQLNPGRFADDELDIVLSWRHQIAGRFYIFRELKKYTVFLSSEKQPVAYAVVALTQPFEELVGQYLPVMTETVLLPFKEKIIYDGLLRSFPISFGPGIRRGLNESFKEAKERHGIVTSLRPIEETAALELSSSSTTARRKKYSKLATDSFLGRWRIIQMDEWDQKFVDADGEAYIKLEDRARGEFQFGYVHGFLDYRATTRDGQQAVEWTWEGNDEMDPAQGRGWAVLKGDELQGMIYFHQGDESGFVAKRAAQTQSPRHR